MTLMERGSFGFDAGWAKLLTDNNAAEATPATTPYHVVFAELMGPFLAGSAFLAAQGEPRGSAAQDPSLAAGRPPGRALRTAILAVRSVLHTARGADRAERCSTGFVAR